MKTTTAIEDLWTSWMQSVPVQLREQDGIKAQFGAAAALIDWLTTKSPTAGWRFEPTTVGSHDDRRGIDGYLINGQTGEHYAVDFSLESANNPAGHKKDTQFLVHLKRDWFTLRDDGIWELRRECMNAFARAFVQVLVRPTKVVKGS